MSYEVLYRHVVPQLVTYAMYQRYIFILHLKPPW